MVGIKTPYTATGSHGEVSWYIGTKRRRVVVFWDAAYNFNHHKNRLAVGLTSVGTTSHPRNRDWYHAVHRGWDIRNVATSDFHRYHRDAGDMVNISDDDFYVRGIMGTSHKTTVRIYLIPRRVANLADDVKADLRRSGLIN